MNLEKQIKRHIIAQRHEYFAVTHPGFEAICRDEIQMLGQGIEILETVSGGVSFSGRLTDLYRANLHLRTAGRLLLRLARFKASNFSQLERHILAFHWERYLPWPELPVVHVTAHHSRLMHSQAVADRIGQMIERRWRQLDQTPAALQARPQSLWVRLQDDLVTLSLDSSGASLYQRGIKTHTGRAPLRETMAAAILLAAGYRVERPLLDPMCGAGTFTLEAALMLKRIAPGQLREFAFMSWPAFRPRQYQYLIEAAQQSKVALDRPMILAADIDEPSCRGLSQCLSRFGLQDAAEVVVRDFFDDKPPRLDDKGQPGLIVLNPPYGRRLSLSDSLEAHYSRIAIHLRRAYKGWSAAVLCPASLRADRLLPGFSSRAIRHGGLNLNLWTGTIC